MLTELLGGVRVHVYSTLPISLTELEPYCAPAANNFPGTRPISLPDERLPACSGVPLFGRRGTAGYKTSRGQLWGSSCGAPCKGPPLGGGGALFRTGGF